MGHPPCYPRQIGLNLFCLIPSQVAVAANPVTVGSVVTWRLDQDVKLVVQKGILLFILDWARFIVAWKSIKES